MEIPAKAGLGHSAFVLQARLGTVSILFLALSSVLIKCDLKNWQGSKDKCAFQIWYCANQSLWMCLPVVLSGAGSIK